MKQHGTPDALRFGCRHLSLLHLGRPNCPGWPTIKLSGGLWICSRLTLQPDVDYGLLTYKIYHFALMYFADLPFIYGNYVFCKFTIIYGCSSIFWCWNSTMSHYVHSTRASIVFVFLFHRIG